MDVPGKVIRDGGLAAVLSQKDRGDSGLAEFFHGFHGAEIERKHRGLGTAEGVAIIEAPDPLQRFFQRVRRKVLAQNLQGDIDRRGEISEDFIQQRQFDALEKCVVTFQEIAFPVGHLKIPERFLLLFQQDRRNVHHDRTQAGIAFQEVPHEITIPSADLENPDAIRKREYRLEIPIKVTPVGGGVFKNRPAGAIRGVKGIAYSQFPAEGL